MAGTSLRRNGAGAALAAALCACAAGGPPASVDVAPGWAANSVNAVVFRKNSLATHEGTQYIAFYDEKARVVLGKRRLGTRDWTLSTTQYTGNARDAHNSISLMVDGSGRLHLSWDHHNTRLRYARAIEPGSLVLGAEEPMTGRDEASVSYPEFYRQPNGGLLFLYRDGGSGRGNLVVNRYDPSTGKWQRLQDNLIGGEGKRNAYWQAFVDSHGTLHVSWTWRESPDVASNHDIAYARSRDGGVSWERSDGSRYSLPILAAHAEYAARIPQNSELINQTAMAADRDGHPVIASYWRDSGSSIPQYRVLYHDGQAWRSHDLGFRRTPFSLSGQGTKAIPIARPQIVVGQGAGPSAWLLFRDAERGSKVSVACTPDLRGGAWTVSDLGQQAVGAWEPSLDTELWRQGGPLHIYVQPVRQLDAEGVDTAGATPIRVVEWQPRC